MRTIDSALQYISTNIKGLNGLGQEVKLHFNRSTERFCTRHPDGHFVDQDEPTLEQYKELLHMAIEDTFGYADAVL